MGLSQINPQVQSRYVDFRLPDVEKQLENPLVDILNCTNLCSVESSISVVIGRSRLRRSQFHKTSWNTRTYVLNIAKGTTDPRIEFILPKLHLEVISEVQT